MVGQLVADMLMQFLIERARRVTHRRGYSPLILVGVQNLKPKYPNGLMEKADQTDVLRDDETPGSNSTLNFQQLNHLETGSMNAGVLTSCR